MSNKMFFLGKIHKIYISNEMQLFELLYINDSLINI